MSEYTPGPWEFKETILMVISRNPGWYADDVAEYLGVSTKLAVKLIGELIDEGILESANGR